MSTTLKTAIVSGGNQGLGLATATVLCQRGFAVTISVRSAAKGDAAIAHIRDAVPGAAIDFLLMDNNQLSSVHTFAQQFKERNTPLHLLINNAGIMNTPFAITSDGFEAQFQVNHLAHFLLTHLLFDCLRQAGNARVVNLSSRAHMRFNEPLNFEDVSTAATTERYDGWHAYGRSKCCNILFTRALAARFPLAADGSGVAVNALHPGLVNTALLDNANASHLRATAIPIEQGIQTVLHLATAEEVHGITGQYFFESKMVSTDPPDAASITKWALSAEEADKLFAASMRMCSLPEGADFGSSSQ